MNFELAPEQVQFSDAVSRFAAKELASDALSRANDAAYPWAVAEKAAKMGLLGLTIPSESGGMGGSLMDAVLAIQAVAAHSATKRGFLQPMRPYR